MSTWRITWGDKSWSETDVTVAHLAAIVTINGIDTWEQINPMAGPSKLISMLAVLIAGEDGRPIDDVLKEIGAATAVQLLNALSVEDPPEPEQAAKPRRAPKR